MLLSTKSPRLQEKVKMACMSKDKWVKITARKAKRNFAKEMEPGESWTPSITGVGNY